MSRGKRRRIAPNVYQDDIGIAVVARLGKRAKEARLPFGASRAQILALQSKLYAALEADYVPPTPREPLERDIDRYLARVGHLTGLDSVRAHLRAWVEALPTRARATISRDDVLRVRSRWSSAGIAPKTINNRCAQLRALYRILDGPDALTPLDRLAPLPVHRTPAISVDVQTILAVDRALKDHEDRHWLRDRKTRARFRVLASTGVRPSELMRAQPTDVDLRRGVWTVRDGKGGFRPGIYLTDDMRRAWELFIAADAWGAFDTYSFARVLRTAGWPANVRPYNLRHSIGIALSEAGVDLADVQQLLGHKHIQTTRRHYVPVRQSRMQQASATLDGRLPWPTE